MVRFTQWHRNVRGLPLVRIGGIGRELQDFFEFLAQFGREARIFTTARDGDVDVAAMHARRDYEAALLGGIRDIGEQTPAFGGDADAVIGPTVVGGGEDQEGAREVGGTKTAANQA